MYLKTIIGIAIPFIGTSLGALCVYFLRQKINSFITNALNGFASGVMIAASIWSLLVPAMEYESSQILGRLSFLPALIGLWLGIGLMFLTERLIPEESIDGSVRKNMLFWSVTLHNLPEGMAVGVLYSAAIANNSVQILGTAISLSIGIAIQNFPEGAIISMPLHGSGMSKHKSFLLGVLSGIVEPIGAILTMLAITLVLPILPILLGIAAGAMIFAVLKELIPSIVKNHGDSIGTVFFAIGFSCMMALDVALG